MDAPVSLNRVAHERLRGDVLAGHWQPGQKLLMHQLRRHYDMGASPLREALNRLATEGLVVHNDQRGFVVAQASIEQLRDLVRTRIALESLALGMAFAGRSAAWEEELVLAFHRLSRAPRSVQPDSYEENPAWEQLHRAFRSLQAAAEREGKRRVSSPMGPVPPALTNCLTNEVSKSGAAPFFRHHGKRSQGSAGNFGENHSMRTNAYVLTPEAGRAAVFFVLLFAVAPA